MNKLYLHIFLCVQIQGQIQLVTLWQLSNELPASQKVYNLGLEAAPPYYLDSQLQVEVQQKKGQGNVTCEWNSTQSVYYEIVILCHCSA